MNNKGLSDVITVILLILLTIVVASTVWVITTGLVKDKIKNSEACFGIFDKINLEPENTCYTSATEQLQFSINVEDIEIDDLMVVLLFDGDSQTFKFSDDNNGIEGYITSEDTTLPEIGGGKTYLISVDKPNAIKIAPIVDGVQCEVSDQLNEIPDCIIQ